MSEQQTPAQVTTPAGSEQKPAEQTPSLLGQESAPAKPEPQAQSTEAKPPAAPVVPEKYDLKLPDQALLKPEHVEKVALFAKERGLTNDQAQAILERENTLLSEQAKATAEHQKQVVESWVGQAKTDKEIGGDAFSQNVELATRVVNRFGTPEFKQALNETGIGNNPHLLKFVVRIAKTMSEDQMVMPGTQVPSKTSSAPEDILYGSMKK